MDKLIFLKIDEIIGEFIGTNNGNKGKQKNKNYNNTTTRDKAKKNTNINKYKSNDSETNSLGNYSNSYKNIESQLIYQINQYFNISYFKYYDQESK